MKRAALVYAVVATPLIATVTGLALQHRALAQSQGVVTGQRPYIVPPGAGKISSPGEWKFVAGQGSGAYSMVEIKVTELSKLPPGPGHVHTREDESWYVIDGELVFDVGDQTLTAGPGTLVYAPRDVPHAYRVTKVPARYLMMFTPAGIEPLFAEVAELRKRFPNEDGAYREELEKLQAKYGARPATGWRRPSESGTACCKVFGIDLTPILGNDPAVCGKIVGDDRLAEAQAESVEERRRATECALEAQRQGRPFVYTWRLVAPPDMDLINQVVFGTNGERLLLKIGIYARENIRTIEVCDSLTVLPDGKIRSAGCYVRN